MEYINRNIISICLSDCPPGFVFYYFPGILTQNNFFFTMQFVIRCIVF